MTFNVSMKRVLGPQDGEPVKYVAQVKEGNTLKQEVIFKDFNDDGKFAANEICIIREYDGDNMIEYIDSKAGKDGAGEFDKVIEYKKVSNKWVPQVGSPQYDERSMTDKSKVDADQNPTVEKKDLLIFKKFIKEGVFAFFKDIDKNGILDENKELYAITRKNNNKYETTTQYFSTKTNGICDEKQDYVFEDDTTAYTFGEKTNPNKPKKDILAEESK